MSSMLDAPTSVEDFDLDELTTEPLPERGARVGFWRTLAQKLTFRRPLEPRARYTRAWSEPYAYDTPMNRMVREYPSLSVEALSII